MKTLIILLVTSILSITGFSQFHYDKMYRSTTTDNSYFYFMINETGSILMTHTTEEEAAVKLMFESKEPNVSLAKAQGKIKANTKASFVITLDEKKSNCIVTGSKESAIMTIMVSGSERQQLTFNLVK